MDSYLASEVLCSITSVAMCDSVAYFGENDETLTTLSGRGFQARTLWTVDLRQDSLICLCIWYFCVVYDLKLSIMSCI